MGLTPPRNTSSLSCGLRDALAARVRAQPIFFSFVACFLTGNIFVGLTPPRNTSSSSGKGLVARVRARLCDWELSSSFLPGLLEPTSLHSTPYNLHPTPYTLHPTL